MDTLIILFIFISALLITANISDDSWMTTVFINSHELKLYLIAALLITLVLLIDDLIRHPAPDAVWVDTPDGIQLRFTRQDP